MKFPVRKVEAVQKQYLKLRLEAEYRKTRFIEAENEVKKMFGKVLTRAEWFKSREMFSQIERFTYFKLVSAEDALKRTNQRLTKQTELFKNLLLEIEAQQKQEHEMDFSEIDESKIKVKTKEEINK